MDQGYTSDSEDEDYIEPEPGRPKKTRRMRKSGVKTDSSLTPMSLVGKPSGSRRRAGKLALMMSMPIDVFCEIAAHLSPEDLLHMARSSKFLRDFFMSKSSKRIWRQAEEALGMPICPPDLSCPQHCHAVRSSRLEAVLRVRLCKKCHNENIERGWKIRRSLKDSKTGPGIDNDWSTIYKLLPGTGGFMESDVTNLQEASIESLCLLKFYRPTFDALLKEYLAFDRTSDERTAFVEERHKIANEIWSHSAKLDDWLRILNNRRFQDNEALKANRKKTILAKLEMLGYSEADVSTELDEQGWKWKALVEQPRELTDRTWKTLLPQLQETIRLRRGKNAQLKIENLIRARKTRLCGLARDFVKSLKDARFCVMASDFVNFPLAKRIITNNGLSVDFHPTLLDPLKEMLIALNETRVRAIENNFVSAVASTNKGSDPKIILQRATTFFTRTSGQTSSVLTTISDTIDTLHLQSSESFEDAANNHFYRYRNHSESWKPGGISLCSRLGNVTNMLIASLGIQEDVSMDHMESLGASFLCLCCAPEIRKLETWCKLVGHFFQEYDEFNSMKEAKSDRNADVKITFDHDVDVKSEKSLVICTGLKTEAVDRLGSGNLDELIKKCSCVPCTTTGYSRPIQCMHCSLLGINKFFGCREKRDTHVRARHGQSKKAGG
ncbi:hypothetical protein DFH11DRAFT_304825 [Phellopilus nigrolimitatus]|nr:hypothetical protein DFH11DRAFT_304825 [Phellopilus nigrolimitatus]